MKRYLLTSSKYYNIFTYSYRPFQYLFDLVKFCLIINIMIDFLLRIVQSSIWEVWNKTLIKIKIFYQRNLNIYNRLEVDDIELTNFPRANFGKKVYIWYQFFLNRINWHNRDIRWNSTKRENLFLRFITCEIWYNKAMTAYYIFIVYNESSFPLCKTQLSFDVILTASIF